MTKKTATSTNLIDRVVGYFSPSAGLRRLGARHAFALAHPAYEAATPGKGRKFYNEGAGPNQLTQKSAVAIRSQARQLHRNHDISRGILRTMVNNIVGANGIGIEPQPRRADGTIHEQYAADLRAAYREWSQRPEVTGRHTIAKVQRMMALTWLRDGEAFAQELMGPVPGLVHGSRIPFSLEMFEPDMVPYYHDDGDRIHQGIERNAWGKPTAFMVYKFHPSDGAGPGFTLSAGQLKRIDANRMHHIALLDRIGQMRGISEFASIITRLEDIKDYEESERIAAKIAAALTAYVKKSSPDGYVGPSLDENGDPVARSISMAPGMVIDSLAVGEEIGLIDSNRPNPNVVTFRQGQLRATAAGVGASYSSIARDYNGTYSAQRQELVEQWVNYATLTDEFTGQFLQPLWTSFVLACDLSGVVKRPRDVSAEQSNDALFIAQSMPWIDPAKEAKAFLSLVRGGFASEVEVLRKRGVNPRDMLEQVASWRKEVADKGLVFNSDAAVPEGGGASSGSDSQTAAGRATKAQDQASAQASIQASQQDAATSKTLDLLGSAIEQLGISRQSPDISVNLDVTAAAMDRAITQAASPFFKQFEATAAAVMEKEMIVNVKIPEQPAPVINVTVEAPKVTLEATVPAASVIVNNVHPAQAVQTVQRNANDEIVSTTTTYLQS